MHESQFIDSLKIIRYCGTFNNIAAEVEPPEVPGVTGYESSLPHYEGVFSVID